VALSTVRAQLHGAYGKLGVSKALAGVQKAQQLGWLQPAPDTEPVEGPLPPAQKAYLAAFDRYLRAWARGEGAVRARLERRYMLGAVYVEARHRADRQ
jgi:hypothetical protein